MTSKEAFEQWWVAESEGDVMADIPYIIIWNAACEYQKQKDAEICSSMVKDELESGDSCWQHMECASAILNQGDE